MFVVEDKRTEIRDESGRHIVLTPTVDELVGVLHADITHDAPVDAVDAKFSNSTCYILEVGIGNERIEITHHIDIASQDTLTK